MTVDDKHAPGAGEIFTNPDMARVLRDMGRDGAKAGFYQGQTVTANVEAVQKHGGTLTLKTYAHTRLWCKNQSASNAVVLSCGKCHRMDRVSLD
jgi:gamma-glutamyltranspeptidase